MVQYGIGRPTSTIFGLQALGLFGKDIPLEGHSLHRPEAATAEVQDVFKTKQ